MTPAVRTTHGLIGDFVAALPAGQRIICSELARQISRDRGFVTSSVRDLESAGALSTEIGQEDRRRLLVFMSFEQARAWHADAGARGAVWKGLSLNAQRGKRTDAPPRDRSAQHAGVQLRFGVWSDGAIAIEGLARKQLTLPAADTGELAQLVATFPEGALQRLLASALKPAFALHVAGREHPMTSDQAAELIAYIEQLPARAIRPPHTPDNRVHRIETPEDAEQ